MPVVLIELIVVAVIGVLLHVRARRLPDDDRGAGRSAVRRWRGRLLGSTAFGVMFGALVALYVRLIGREITLAFSGPVRDLAGSVFGWI